MDVVPPTRRNIKHLTRLQLDNKRTRAVTSREMRGIKCVEVELRASVEIVVDWECIPEETG